MGVNTQVSDYDARGQPTFTDTVGEIEDMTVWELARTGAYSNAFTLLEPWYDAIGLQDGYVLPPGGRSSASKARVAGQQTEGVWASLEM